MYRHPLSTPVVMDTDHALWKGQLACNFSCILSVSYEGFVCKYLHFEHCFSDIVHIEGLFKSILFWSALVLVWSKPKLQVWNLPLITAQTKEPIQCLTKRNRLCVDQIILWIDVFVLWKLFLNGSDGRITRRYGRLF